MRVYVWIYIFIYTYTLIPVLTLIGSIVGYHICFTHMHYLDFLVMFFLVAYQSGHQYSIVCFKKGLVGFDNIESYFLICRKRWIFFPPETGCMKATRVPYEESSVYSELNFYCPSNLDAFNGNGMDFYKYTLLDIEVNIGGRTDKILGALHPFIRDVCQLLLSN